MKESQWWSFSFGLLPRISSAQLFLVVYRRNCTTRYEKRFCTRMVRIKFFIHLYVHEERIQKKFRPVSCVRWSASWRVLVESSADKAARIRITPTERLNHWCWWRLNSNQLEAWVSPCLCKEKNPRITSVPNWHLLTLIPYPNHPILQTLCIWKESFEFL